MSVSILDKKLLMPCSEKQARFRFDLQVLENPEISGVEYPQGDWIGLPWVVLLL